MSEMKYTEPMDDDRNIKQLRGEAERLLRLLAKPEPGLSSWNEAIRDQIISIGAFAGLKR